MIHLFLIHDHDAVCATLKAAVRTLPEFNLIGEKHTGRAGVQAVLALPTRPRLIIVRLNLPDMGGFDFITQVREKAPDLYFVPALEGKEGGQVRQALEEQGLRDIISGSSPVDEMVTVLQSAAGRAKQKFNDFYQRE